MYLSAIFYTVNVYPEKIQKIFFLNPVYTYITYFRQIVIDNMIPSLSIHLLCIGYALAALAIGAFIYKKYNYKFMYYM